MSEPRIETPEAMVEARIPSRENRRVAGPDGWRDGLTEIVRARDEQIAAVAVALAEGAEREAKTHDAAANAIYAASNEDHVTADAGERDGARRCEGQAAAFRAIAAMLRSAT